MMAMVAMPSGLVGILLDVLLRRLLDVRKVLLCRLQISRLQVLSQLAEGLQQWIGIALAVALAEDLAGDFARGLGATLAAHGLAVPRNILGQRREIRLRLAQIAGLKVLRQLLEFTSYLLKFRLAILRTAQSGKNAA